MKKRYIAFYPLWYPKREHDYIFYFNIGLPLRLCMN